jgi:galactose mutarotase-like enzyme
LRFFCILVAIFHSPFSFRLVMSDADTSGSCSRDSGAVATELEVTTIQDDSGGDVKVRSFRLVRNGVTADLCALGACIHRLLLPGGANNDDCDDVVLGFENISELHDTSNPMYFGVTAGRVANRIRAGILQTSRHGPVYQLATNNGPNHLHGGTRGLSTRIWDADIIRSSDKKGDSVKFSYLSADGEEGYPGTVTVTATYSLLATPSAHVTKLCLSLTAELLDDKPSPINLTQHTYFNLAGHNANNGILDHTLRLYCDSYTPTDESSIPTRHVQILDNDPIMDWRCPRSLQSALTRFGTDRVGLSHEQVQADLAQRGSPLTSKDIGPYGFDHNYVVRRSTCEDGLSLVAILEHDNRRLSIRSTQPGVQLYTANYLDGTLPKTGKDSQAHSCGYNRWQGVCLETQHFPDSILVDDKSHPDFAVGQCLILSPERRFYEQSVEYTFENRPAVTASSVSTAGFHGTDSDGNHFYSLDDMWEHQGVTQESSLSWYERAALYYKENCPSTIDGVLGGFASISESDLEGSRQFFRELEDIRPSLQSWTTKASNGQQRKRACECGAGLGRVTKGLLFAIRGIDECDLVDSSAALLAAAPEYLGNPTASRCRYFCTGLQDWMPAAKTYSIVWIQWVLSYLTDEDIVKVLRRCGESLTVDGVIILKENTCAESDFEVDSDDASVTRSLRYWKVLFHLSGLRVIHEKYESLLKDLYPFPMLALEPAAISR